MAEYEYSAQLDGSQVLSELQEIRGLMKTLVQQGQESMDKIGKEAEISSGKIGLISGVVQSVTTKLLEMGAAAVRVLKDMVVDSVNVAKNFETINASLLGIFDGSQEQATAAFDFIRKESRRLGVDLSEIAPAFLPKVESLDQFSQVGQLIAALANRDPETGASGARVALLEALSGDTHSLQERFEISKEDIASIKELQKELGQVEGLIVGLDNVLAESGQSFEQYQDTANVALGQIQQFFVDLQATFGQPILDAFRESLVNVRDLLTENEVEIKVLVDALGRLLAAALEIASSGAFDFAEKLDVEKIIGFIEEVNRLLEYLKAATDLLGQAGEPLRQLFALFDDGQSGPMADFFDRLVDGRSAFQIFVDGIGEALKGLVALNAIFSSGFTSLGEMISSIDDVIARRKTVGEVFEDAFAAGGQAFRQAMDEGRERINQAEQNAADFASGTDAARDEFSTEKDLTAVNNTLAQNAAAEEEAAKAKEELAQAQEKVNKALEDYDTDKARKAAEEQIKIERELIDLQIKFSQQREDIARKNADKIADIYAKNRQRIADAARDLERDQQDIVKSGARKQEDLDRDSAQERIQIEEDYQRELIRIKNKFTFDAQEAIRANDAIAFLAAQRRRDQELQDAESNRQTEIQNATSNAQQRREELAIELQREVEDAQLANHRKLEDLQIALQQELEQQAIAYERQLQEQAIKEQRETEQLQTAQNRRKMDFDRYWQQRLEDLQRNLKKELDLIAKHEEQVAELRRKAAARIRHDAGTVKRGDEDDEGNTDEGTIRTGPGVRAQQRHSGGHVNAGEMYRLQANEFFAKAPFTGQVLPVNRLMNGQTGGANVTVNNSPTANFPIELMRGLKPADMQRIQQFVYQVLMESFEG